MRTDPPEAPTRREADGAKVVAGALGVCVGVSGLDHGFFEALQGNATTPGLFVHAIGPAQQVWEFGTEDAFTLVPNFLASGVLAMIVGFLTIVWSIGFIDRPQGSRVLLGLGGLLFVVGGGVAIVVPLAIAWAMARGIRGAHRPTRRIVSPGVTRILSRAWPALVALGLVLYALSLEIAIVGFVPAVADPAQVLAVCWVALLAMLVAFIGAFVGARAPSGEGTSGRVPSATSGVRAG